MDAISNNVKTLSLPAKLYWLSFAVCFAIVAGTFNSIFSYLALVVSAISIVLINEDDAICFMMLIMSFANIFKSSPESQSFFTYLVLFYVLWHFIKIRRISKALLTAIACLGVFKYILALIY